VTKPQATKLLIVGASGQVASAFPLVAHPDVQTIVRGRPALDLERPETIESAIDVEAPDVVAVVGAYTAVDLAETEAKKACLVNALGPERVALACARRDIPVILVSTDYVFSGDKPSPYVETDPVNPQNVYGATKLEGEQRVAAASSRSAILRTAWVYSYEGKNFVRTMLRLARARPELGVVADQFGCPTYAPDLAHAIALVARTLAREDRHELYGVFHAAGAGECAWADFARAIFEESAKRGGPAAMVNPIPASAYPAPAKRPANSRLDCSKLERTYGVRLPEWRTSLTACMDRIAAGGFAVD
jgi:dTDP-4-dehydrorhamnose reductase